MKRVSNLNDLLNQTDRILVKNLKAKTIIGVHDWEKEKPRDIILNLSLGFNIKLASQTDSLVHTIDYDHLSNRLIQFIENQNFNLIESLIEACAQIILTEYDVDDVLITIDKPKAIPISDSVAIQIFRDKQRYGSI